MCLFSGELPQMACLVAYYFLATWERSCLHGESLAPPNCIISFSKGVHCVALFSLKNTVAVNGFEFDLVYGYKVK
jgi:hypothetical protein